MESPPGKYLLTAVLLSLMMVGQRGARATIDNIPQAQNIVPSLEEGQPLQENVVTSNKGRSNGGGCRGGGYGWGWGGGGGGGGGGGWGWGWGGGGGGYYGWGCRNQPGRSGHRLPKKRGGQNEEYKMGEFAECMARGRCRGMRLDCPLHCRGPCFYDCRHMCEAHCRR